MVRTRPWEAPSVLCRPQESPLSGSPSAHHVAHLSVCLPDFCLSTASAHLSIILAFFFSINLTLSLSTCLSICLTVCLLDLLSFCLPVHLPFALCLPCSVTTHSPTVSVTSQEPLPAPLSSPGPGLSHPHRSCWVSGSHHPEDARKQGQDKVAQLNLRCISTVCADGPGAQVAGGT